MELYNPYPFAIPMAGYQIVRVDRDPATAAVTTPNLQPDPLATGLLVDFSAAGDVFPGGGGIVVPPQGYLVLENYPGVAGALNTTGAATARPAASGLPVAGPV